MLFSLLFCCAGFADCCGCGLIVGFAFVCLLSMIGGFIIGVVLALIGAGCVWIGLTFVIAFDCLIFVLLCS